jgi:hypothetical protein
MSPTVEEADRLEGMGLDSHAYQVYTVSPTRNRVLLDPVAEDEHWRERETLARLTPDKRASYLRLMQEGR